MTSRQNCTKIPDVEAPPLRIYGSPWMRSRVNEIIAHHERLVRGCGILHEDLVADFMLRLAPSLSKFSAGGNAGLISFIHRCARAFLIDVYRASLSREDRERYNARSEVAPATDEVTADLIEQMVAIRLRIDGPNAQPGARATYTPGQQAALALMMLRGWKYRAPVPDEVMERLGLRKRPSHMRLFQILQKVRAEKRRRCGATPAGPRKRIPAP